MYHRYFGLNEAPFSIAVNPRYLFMSARHRDALAHLLYGVGSGGGFILLTGEVGTGKTTINRCLLEQLPPNTDIAIILNPALNAMELLASACDELGIDYQRRDASLKVLTDQLHRFLLLNHQRGRKTVLLIDEAQHLDFEVLEQIRLLTNLETDSQKLLQIILIGQPELAQTLTRPELRQLNQRITARYNLEPLNFEETGAYIRHRLQVAGLPADRELFPRPVVKGIYQRTRGIPRLINLLCDRTLLGAYGRNRSKADMAMLRIATREVMGEETAGQFQGGNRRGLAIAATLLLGTAIAAAAWYLLPRESRAPALSEAPSVTPIRKAPSEAPSGTPIQLPGITDSPESPIIGEQQSAETLTESRSAPVQAPAVEAPGTPPWLQTPAAALQQIWRLHSPAAMPVDPCHAAERDAGAPRCETGLARSWSELMAFGRPVLLYMQEPDRQDAASVLLWIDDGEAQVLTADGMRGVRLPQLAPFWTGQYSYFWQPPAGFDGDLAIWSESPVVAEVALMFAQLDGQTEPLSDRVFNRALDSRVRLFQQSHGLAVDGVVGQQTLLKLNEALGVDPSVENLRRHWGGAENDL